MTRHRLAYARSWRLGLLVLAVVAAGLSVATPAAAATVSTGGPYSGAEGDQVAIRGTGSGATSYRWSVARAPGGQQESARCAFGDASALSTEIQCHDDGIFDLTLSASDGTSETTRLTLTNVRPVLTHVRPATGTAVAPHAVVTVSATYRDPGWVDNHKYVINWGDRSSSRAYIKEGRNGTGALSGSHSYARSGIRWVRVRILDSHGAGDSVLRRLRVVRGARTPCSRVEGAGRLPGHPSSPFFLWAHCGAAGALGAVRLRLLGHGQFVSTNLTLLRGQRRAATMAGTGRWRAAGENTWHPHYRYLLSVLDPRSGHDRLNVGVRTPAGGKVFHLWGVISGGNITVRH